jgi:GH18 family chitinase
MKKLIFLIMAAALTGLCLKAQKEVIGYYPNWQWYDRGQLVNPETIFYEKYSIINYAFFRPQANGVITSTDAWADENLLLGPMIWWPDPHNDSTRSLPYLALQAGVKLLPSIGGWNDSNHFPAIAADPAKRQTFVNACINLINTYKFDGIDLDWEYPGYAPHGGSPADKQNFTLLLQDLRQALDALSWVTGKDFLLTSCFGPADSHMQHIDWENILPLLDWVNLMTYDFHGSWDPESNHHTPLYSPAVGDPDWCFDGAFNLITQTYNVPPEKINIGVAFYGKGLANCTQLYGPHTGYDGSTFWEDEGQPLYYNILKKMDLFTYHWDDQVKCPYLLGNTINTFVTFDDPVSIAYKAQYVMDNNIGGVIIWEITGDYIETTPGSGVIAGTPLLDTLNHIFSDFKTQTVFLQEGWNGLSSYINPFNDDVEDIFSDILNQLIILQSDSALYWPDQNVNTIGEWDTHRGYSIKVTNDVELTFSGTTETNKTLQLSTGWNLMPVIAESAIDVSALFKGQGVVLVKEVAGWRLYWPEMQINTLVSLHPGKSYFVLMNRDAIITFPSVGR